MYNKEKYIILICVVLNINFNFLIYGQTNLIRNFSFEDAYNTPKCQYSPQVSSANVFDDDIMYWSTARSSELGVPDWIDITNGGCMETFFNFLCNPNPVFISNRFIFLQTTWSFNLLDEIVYKHDGIRIELLLNPLIPGDEYLLKIKIIPSYEIGVFENFPPLSNMSKLRVFFTTYGWKWNSSNENNQNYEPITTNIEMAIPYKCNWQCVERTFIVPNEYDQLKNLVLYSEENGFFIDDVELYKKDDYYCSNNLYIQNKTYDGYFYNSNIQNIPFITSAIDHIYAGYNVTGEQTTGDVLIKNGATITYKTRGEIFFEDGFKVEEGAFFDAFIEDVLCSGSNKSMEIPSSSFSVSEAVGFDTIIDKTKKDIELFIIPNPSQGNFIIQYTNGVIENATTQVFDMLGNIVYEENQASQKIDLRGLAEGIYYIQVFNKELFFSEKIVIQR